MTKIEAGQWLFQANSGIIRREAWLLHQKEAAYYNLQLVNVLWKSNFSEAQALLIRHSLNIANAGQSKICTQISMLCSECDYIQLSKTTQRLKLSWIFSSYLLVFTALTCSIKVKCINTTLLVGLQCSRCLTNHLLMPEQQNIHGPLHGRAAYSSSISRSKDYVCNCNLERSQGIIYKVITVCLSEQYRWLALMSKWIPCQAINSTLNACACLIHLSPPALYDEVWRKLCAVLHHGDCERGTSPGQYMDMFSEAPLRG